MFHPPVRVEVHSSNSTQPSVQSQINQMQQDIERLLMITEALWQICKEDHNYTDNELIRRVAEIDMRDGKLDGRVKPTECHNCPHCQRKLAKHRPFCLYCGKPVAMDMFQR